MTLKESLNDRLRFWTAMVISIFLHLLFLVISLLVPIFTAQPIPEIIEMSFGQPTNAEAFVSTRSLEAPAMQASITPQPQPQQEQPQPERAVVERKPAPAKAAANVTRPPARESAVPAKVNMPVAESRPDEQISMPTEKKFAAQDRFKNQDRRLSTTPAASDNMGQSREVHSVDDATSASTSETSSSTEKESYGDVASANEKETGSANVVGPDRPGPVAASGNTNLPVEIMTDLKNRKLISQPFPQRVEGLTKDNIIELVFLVAPDGSVYSIRPLKKGDSVLEKVSIEAIRKWRFSPVTGAVDPFEVRVRIRSQLD